MKKKIITLVLAAIMCLSAITPVTATSTLNRVASTIPGTDIEYNYVENVTIKIPGTGVTFDLEKVADTIYVDYDEDYDFPIYTFLFYEKDGTTKVNQYGEWLLVSMVAEEYGDGMWFDIDNERTFSHFGWCSEGEDPDEEAAKAPFSFYETNIFMDNSCKYLYDASIDTPIMTVVFKFSNGTYDITPKQSSKKKNIQDFAVVGENSYSIIEGANSVVNSDENLLTIRVDGDFDKFKGVKVDGDLIDSSNYTATEGSTIIDFKSGYLETLDEGEHTVSVVFTDGEATTKFEIKNYIFTIQEPSRTTIRSKDGIILHSNIEGTVPTGSYVEWTASNNKFKTTEIDNGKALKIISNNNGYTTFTATLYDADGKELACDTVEMYSKAGFFDKIGGFFRSLFGTTKIYDN